MTQEEKEELSLAVGAATDALNKLLSDAWRAELSVTIEMIKPKFTGLAGLELIEVQVYLPMQMGDPTDTGSVVSRALARDGA